MGIANKIQLNSYESLFGNDNENIINIDLNDLRDFKNHPFKVLDNNDMDILVESIKQNGVINPIIVRKYDHTKYEILSGHRRSYASKIAGLKTIPAIIKEINDDDATIAMVDSNLSREKILPSERAFSYKMKFEALSHKGKKGSDTNEEIGKVLGDSARQVQRYTRLTNLIPNLLDLVDDEKIKLIPAVELSYLPESNQTMLYKYLDDYAKTVTLKIAKAIRTLSESNQQFNYDNLNKIFNRQSSNKTDEIDIFNIQLSKNVVSKFFVGKNKNEIEEIIKSILLKNLEENTNEI